MDRLGSLKVWKRGGQRAPHKPLLLLLALARMQRGAPRACRFVDIEQELSGLLRQFGPPSQSRQQSPQYPFWHLASDRLWELQGQTEGLLGKGGAPRVSALRDAPLSAGLRESDHAALAADPSLLGRVARRLLEDHFTPGLHDDLLDALGLDLSGAASGAKRRRDPAFRVAVLDAYAHRCAVCGLQIVCGGSVEGVEAAHVKWHAAGGPDTVCNGLALCAQHHKALDRGYVAIDPVGALRVSDSVSGGEAFEASIGRHEGSALATPRHVDQRLDDGYRQWHWREVFRGLRAA